MAAKLAERFVEHPAFGPGRVLETRYLGFELLVAFTEGLPRWVRRTAVSAYQPKQEQPVAVLRVPNETSFKARKLIEALRLGVVPFDCVDAFTFGRTEETSAIEAWLLNPSPTEGAMAVIGEYGSGKTHLLQWTLPRAVRLGFGVASIETDPHETPFYKPLRIYRRFTSRFRYRCPKDNTIKGFRDLLREAFSRGYFLDHPYFGLVHKNKDNEDYWLWIEGERNYYYSTGNGRKLYDHTTAGNIFTYLLSSLSWFACEVMGLKGILLAFDEAESVNMAFGMYRHRAKSFMDALIRTASNEELLLSAPEACDLVCSGLSKDIPFLYRMPCGLKAMFAFTSVEINGPSIAIKTFSVSELERIFNEIHKHYETAYSCRINGEQLTNLKRGIFERTTKTRGFIKASVEALDIARLVRADEPK